MESNSDADNRINGGYRRRIAKDNYIINILGALGIITSFVAPNVEKTKSKYKEESVAVRYEATVSQRDSLEKYINSIGIENRTSTQSMFIESELERLTRIERELKINPIIIEYLENKEKNRDNIGHTGLLVACTGLAYILSSIFVEGSAERRRMREWAIYNEERMKERQKL